MYQENVQREKNLSNALTLKDFSGWIEFTDKDF